MSTYHLPAAEWHGRRVAPATRLGAAAVALALASAAGWIVALPAIVFGPPNPDWLPWGVVLIVGLVPGFLCGIAASIVAFLAMLRRGERALAVYLGYVPVVCILATSAVNSLFFAD